MSIFSKKKLWDKQIFNLLHKIFTQFVTISYMGHKETELGGDNVNFFKKKKMWDKQIFNLLHKIFTQFVTISYIKAGYAQSRFQLYCSRINVRLNNTCFKMNKRPLRRWEKGKEDMIIATKKWQTNIVYVIPDLEVLCYHSGHIGCKKVHPRNYFCIFYSCELKLCRMVELYILKKPMFFVFRF